MNSALYSLGIIGDYQRFILSKNYSKVLIVRKIRFVIVDLIPVIIKCTKNSL